jgi:D-galactarolactone cycloisomerase
LADVLGFAMRVVSAEVIHLRVPLRVPAGPAGVFNSRRETLLLRLEAADGTVGWGETYALPGTMALLGPMAQDLVGTSLERAWPRPAGLDEVGAALALGAIDMAWHDLLGRALGVPVHVLIGGAVRERVPAYASGFLYRRDRHPAQVWPAEAKAALERGFRAMKVRIGALPPAEEMALLEELRRSLPDDVELMVDAWGAYAPATAVWVGERLGELGMGWFEEPTHHEFPALAARLSVPVAGGEMGRTRAEFTRWIASRTFDVLQPDLAICGGFGVARFVGELAAISGIGCVPHSWNGPVMAAATLHLASVLPAGTRVGDGTRLSAGPMLEYDTSENPLMSDIVRRPLAVVDGFVAVPDSPGLGVDIDEQAVADLRVA